MDNSKHLQSQSQALKMYREQRSQSLREVSEGTGIELTRLSRLEAGKYIINAIEVALLEEYYSIYAGHLFSAITWQVVVEKRKCT